jgi:hypothetical protein
MIGYLINISGKKVGIMAMLLNTTLSNISGLSWWSVLLVEESGVPGEIHQP